ncbi:hypothetical protein ACW9HR_22350 [Nocardia gipuzkoensis]
MISIPEFITWLSGLDPSSHLTIDHGVSRLIASSTDTTPATSLILGGHHADAPAPTELTGQEPVITVADLLDMVGGTLTVAELTRLRQSIPRSSVRDSLSEVLAAAIDAQRNELARTATVFEPPAALAGCLSGARIAAQHPWVLGAVLHTVQRLSGIRIVRVRYDDIAHLCVADPATGRCYELGGDLEAWLYGDTGSPGDPARWIGDAIHDYTYGDLIPDQRHDYHLPPDQPNPTGATDGR